MLLLLHLVVVIVVFGRCFVYKYITFICYTNQKKNIKTLSFVNRCGRCVDDTETSKTSTPACRGGFRLLCCPGYPGPPPEASP